MTPMPKTPISQTVVASAAGSWLPGAAGAELSAFFAKPPPAIVQRAPAPRARGMARSETFIAALRWGY